MYIANSQAIGAVAALALALSAPAAGVTRHVFVTSTWGDADLSTWAETDADGLTGADAICKARAVAAGLANATSYRAWLSTASTDAYCHLFGLDGERSTSCNGHFPDASAMGPWVRMDGTPFAGTLAEMTGSAHKLFQPVLFDETGATVEDSQFFAWTGTDENGVQFGLTCSDWSSASSSSDGSAGVAWYVGRDWTYFGSFPCSDTSYLRLYCFEPGAGDPQPLAGRPGSLAFVTSVAGKGDLHGWTQSGGAHGIAAGDAVCRARAAAAQLPEPDSFIAWLSDPTTDAIDRLTSDGPFVRVDGFVFAPSKSALFGLSPDLATGLDVTELETYYLEIATPYVWTGTEYDGGMAVNHCGGWTSSLHADQGHVGASSSTLFTWTSAAVGYCDGQRPIYCFSNLELLAWDNFERGDTSRWSLAAP
jgi:hypothetical protein